MSEENANYVSQFRLNYTVWEKLFQFPNLKSSQHQSFPIVYNNHSSAVAFPARIYPSSRIPASGTSQSGSYRKSMLGKSQRTKPRFSPQDSFLTLLSMFSWPDQDMSPSLVSVKKENLIFFKSLEAHLISIQKMLQSSYLIVLYKARTASSSTN